MFRHLEEGELKEGIHLLIDNTQFVVGSNEAQELTGTITIVVKKKEQKTHGIWLKLFGELNVKKTEPYSCRGSREKTCYNTRTVFHQQRTIVDEYMCFDFYTGNDDEEIQVDLNQYQQQSGILSYRYKDKKNIKQTLSRGTHSIRFKIILPSTLNWNESLHQSNSHWNLNVSYHATAIMVRSSSNLKKQIDLTALHATPIGLNGYQTIQHSINKGTASGPFSLDKNIYSEKDELKILVEKEFDIENLKIEFWEEFEIINNNNYNNYNNKYVYVVPLLMDRNGMTVKKNDDGGMTCCSWKLRQCLAGRRSRMVERDIKSRMVVQCSVE
eukprot:TRINITY_DN17017_c0_g1_i1.p1 TRINITY_DN17017_c0_g1~~TRINITY_DN17017_c0_g1_i1.p1  ORF type:complete len:327 (-),score=80.36 TRINITY_DN17017_c0_g1_i1:117-1097(-)